MSVNNRISILDSLSKLPPDEIQPAVDLAFQLITDEMDGVQRVSILSTIFDLPAEERQPAVALTLQLITPEMNWIERLQIISKIKKLPAEERQPAVDLALHFINWQTSGIQRLNIFSKMIDLPAVERQSAVNLALQFITDDMGWDERLEIFSLIKDLPADQRQAAVDLALQLITEETSGSVRLRIFSKIKRLPAEERQSAVDLAFQLITQEMNGPDRSQIVYSLSTLPAEERQSAVDLALQLIAHEMNGTHRSRIFYLLSTLPAHERQAAVDLTSLLITHETNGYYRSRILHQISSLPAQERHTLVGLALQLITPEMSEYDRSHIIYSISSIPAGQRESAVDSTLEVVENIGEEADRAQILSQILSQQPVINVQNEFSTSLEEIAQEPQSVLQKYAGSLQSGISKVKYQGLDEVGIDGSGVRRDFITRLFQKLYPEFQAGALYDDQGLAIPTLCLEPYDGGLHYSTGVVIGEILSGRLKATLGNRLSPVFYRMLHAFSQEDLGGEPDQESDVFKTLFRIYAQDRYTFLTEDDLNKLLGGELPECLQTDDVLTAQDFFRDSKFYSVFEAALMIAKGINSSTPWNEGKKETPQILMEAVQGTFSKDELKEKLDWLGDPLGEAPAYLTQWIDEADAETLKKLLFCISGSETLSASRLTIKLFNPNHPLTLPSFHTCILQMDLPRYDSYELFKERLETSLAHAVSNEDGGAFQVM